MCPLSRDYIIMSVKGKSRNAKVGSQETPGVTDKFGLGIQNETGQRLIEFCIPVPYKEKDIFFGC